MSAEDYEIYKILKTENQKAGQNRRQVAIRDFKEASILAAQNGLQLSKCDHEGIRFRLKCKDWIKDIYPGNQRIYCPNPEKSGPFLRLPVSWQLKDVVLAAINKGE